MAVNGSAVAVAPPSAVDPVVAEAMAMSARLVPLKNALGCGDLTNEEMDLFAMVALRMRLDPFQRQIYAVKRKGKVTFQTGIDGFRSSAEETDQYRGSEEPEYGPVIDKPFPHPEWARVTVLRRMPDGELIRQSATARWDEFYPGDGPDSFMWKKMPYGQLAKCSEAQAFRRAFPKRFGGVYVTEEMQQAEAAEVARPVGPVSARERVAQERARIEAQTTSAPAVAAAAAVQGSPAGGPAYEDPAAAASPDADATGSGEDAVIEGQAREVTTGGVTGGELREWLREQRITIPQAREVCMRLFRLDSFDALTDEQRGMLVLELDGGARS